MEKPSRLKTPTADTDVSALLRAWSGGDQDALQALTPSCTQSCAVLPEVTCVASVMAQPAGHCLGERSLYAPRGLHAHAVQDRAHFFAVSAQVMRRILVDTRARHNVKRGRGVQHVLLEDVVVVAPGETPETDLVALDDALIA